MASRFREFVATHFTLVNFFVGGSNLGAGTTTIGNALNNYLAFDLYLRLIGICVILLFLGSIIAILEVFPQPNFVDKHANILNTYFGRSILYMMIALLSSNIVQVQEQRKLFLQLTWLCAGSLAGTSILFMILGLVDVFWKPLPVSISMTITAAAANKKTTFLNGVNGRRKNESGWVISEGENNNDDINSISMQKVQSPPYGDPFDQGSISQSGWTQYSTPDYSNPKLPDPIKMEPNFEVSTYSIDLSSSPSYNQHQFNNTSDSRLHWIRSSELPSSSDDLIQQVQQQQGKSRSKGDEFYSRSNQQLLPNSLRGGLRYKKEVNASQDHLLPTSHDSRGNSQIVFTHDHFNRSRNEKLKWTPHQQSSKPPRKRQPSGKDNNHKRVFVPGIGSFDLSSGSESDGEDELKQNGDNDDDSVNSLDSDIDIDRVGIKVGAKLGRKLTRKETQIYRGKLNRGMQRVMSQANHHSKEDRCQV